MELLRLLDDVFQPVALLESYRPLGGTTYLPFVRDPWLYLPHVAALAQLTRFKLGMHVGRKTYATLKVYQGLPKSLVMLATRQRPSSTCTWASTSRSCWPRTARRLGACHPPPKGWPLALKPSRS